MAIKPVYPNQVETEKTESDDEATTRRTFGMRYPSRRTFGKVHPSRRTFGRQNG